MRKSKKELQRKQLRRIEQAVRSRVSADLVGSESGQDAWWQLVKKTAETLRVLGSDTVAVVVAINSVKNPLSFAELRKTINTIAEEITEQAKVLRLEANE